MPAEAFSIEIRPDSVIITGADARGCLYGVYAFESKIAAHGNAWRASCGTFKDWPDLRIRGLCLDLLQPAIRDVSIMKRYILALSRARGNTIILNHTPEQVTAWKRNADDGGWTKKQIQEIAAYARSLHIDVWGGMGSGFDARTFPAMHILSGSNLYNPFDDDSYNTLFALYDEVLDAYAPKTLLIAHDEITGLNQYAERYHMTTAAILANDVNRIRDWLHKKGVRTAMWGDMLLESKVWTPLVGDANSQTRLMSGATHDAIDRISKDVVILDWHYAEYSTPSEYRSIEYFAKHGFTVVGSPYYKPAAANLMAKSVRSYGGAGLIGTSWGFGITLSPASTTLYTLLSGWSTAVKVDGDGDDVEALAQMMRPAIYNRLPMSQTPLDLERFSNSSLKDMILGGSGLFPSAPRIELAGVPTGKSIMGGVVFEIASAGKNAVVVTQVAGNIVPTVKMETIDVGQHANAVAFLQTGFISKPRHGVAKVGEYEITYETGRKIAVPILEDYNMTDIRSSEGLRSNSWTFTRNPEVLVGSATGWRGSSASGIRLNLQTFIWSNPFPNEAIQTISLRADSADRTVKLVLVGLTLL
jgi:hypothetical protein